MPIGLFCGYIIFLLFLQIESKGIEQHDENVRKGLVEYSASSEDFSCDDSDNDPTFQLDKNGQDIYSDESMDYQSLEENTGNQSFKARWRLRNEQNWKVNIIKENRANCLPYNNKKKSCPAKAPREVNCFRCRFYCSENFNEEDRINICKSYWALKEYKRQKDFLINHVQVLEPKRRKVNESNSSRRAVSKCYYLSNSKGRFRVCANFFEKTLCISNGPINTALKGKSHVGCYEGDDHRGKKTPGNKTKDEQVALVKEHIKSFPCIEAHYVRQSSQKKYLDANLSILKMYALYKELCAEKQVEAVSEPTYRRIFSTSFNLSFHKPKKDQCPSCSKYLSADANQKNEMELEYSMHIIRKNECNEAKDSDKQRSLRDPSFQTVTFDLQSVLQLPFSSVSQFYYSRKLCVYNLTFYEGNGNNAYCYVWNEINGKRGSNEIGSSILRYIQTLKEEVTHLSMFSDTCSGQNRNQQVAAALLYAVQNTHLTVIEQKFLESGHTHMECDSMHSSIENARKNKTCFMMNDWLNIFKDARSNRGKNKDKAPYQVVELKYKDVWDLQALAACTLKNKNTDENGEKVNWLKIKCLKFEKAYPHAIFYRYDHSSEYKKIDIQQRSRRNPITQNVELKQAYNAILPISIQKKNDLLKLCRSGLIPDELHDWYKNLPANGSLRQNDIFELEDENDDF